MTESQCQTCKAPSPQCQSPQFAHLMNASCLNHTPVAAGEVPWMQRDRAPFEQVAIESHDTDQMETLYHIRKKHHFKEVSEPKTENSFINK